MNLLLYVFVLPVVLSFESVCKKLHVSTDIEKTKDDVVKSGSVVPNWGKTTTTPVLVNSSILFDFLYVTVETKKGFTADMFELEFDDHYFANSTAHLEHKSQNTYSIKIDYKCKQYGGALVDYELKINIPDCGTARLYWTKICGTPMVKRHGLTIDLSVKKYNQTIVEDGGLLNSSYFDRDVDNLAFTVPENVNYTVFYLYMDLPPGQTSDSKEESKEFFQAVDEERKQQGPASDEFQVLEAILKMVPEVKISQPFIDSDHTYLKPIITGDLANGGVVTDEPQTLIVEYNCLSTGETTVELNIPLDYFQDITMVFVKQCKVVEESLLLTYIFYIFIIIVVAYFIMTMKSQHHSRLNQLFEQIMGQRGRYYIRLPFSRNGSRFKRDEDYESEFKETNLQQQQGQYGSI